MRYFALAIVLILQGFFEIIPNWHQTRIEYDFFPLSDQLLTAQTYAWFVFGHVVLLLLSYLLIVYSRYKVMVKVFFALQVAYFIDFLIGYNENWFGFIEIHLVSMAIFAIAWLKYGRGNNHVGNHHHDGGFESLPKAQTQKES